MPRCNHCGSDFSENLRSTKAAYTRGWYYDYMCSHEALIRTVKSIVLRVLVTAVISFVAITFISWLWFVISPAIIFGTSGILIPVALFLLPAFIIISGLKIGIISVRNMALWVIKTMVTPFAGMTLLTWLWSTNPSAAIGNTLDILMPSLVLLPALIVIARLKLGAMFRFVIAITYLSLIIPPLALCAIETGQFFTGTYL